MMLLDGVRLTCQTNHCQRERFSWSSFRQPVQRGTDDVCPQDRQCRLDLVILTDLSALLEQSPISDTGIDGSSLEAMRSP